MKKSDLKDAYQDKTEAGEVKRQAIDEKMQKMRDKYKFIDNLIVLDAEEHNSAKPQITVSVNSKKVGRFVNRLTENREITYEKGSGTIDGEMTEKKATLLNRSEEVIKLMTMADDADIEKTKNLVGFLSETAQGVFWLTIMAGVMASGVSANYYKSRFPVLSRVAISKLYDLVEDYQLPALTARLDEWAEWMDQKKPNGIDSWHADGKEDAPEKKTASFKQFVKSVYSSASRKSKTGSAKKVDILASDEFASTGGVGSAVGEYELYDDKNMIFEYRALPYVPWNDADAAIGNFNTLLAAFNEE